MSIKIYIHVELDGYPDQTSKIQVPKSWVAKEVKDVINLFLGSYNKKYPDQTLNIENVHFATNDGRKIYSNDVVSDVLEDHADYYVKIGPHLRPTAAPIEENNLLRCKNYGCNQYFSEEENNDTACCYHIAPPIFHDTMKCWSCCKDKKAYDFESFQLIKGCTYGRHSTVAQKVAIADSPNAVKPNATAVTTAPVLKSIADYNTANPTATSAATSALKTITQSRKSTRSADGLTAKCQRKGCQKTFTIADNNASACIYHQGQPVFHDAIKIWSCCPDKKCYDFDEFLAVPGCCTGVHDDGVIDL